MYNWVADGSARSLLFAGLCIRITMYDVCNSAQGVVKLSCHKFQENCNELLYRTNPVVFAVLQLIAGNFLGNIYDYML